jgi:hypothetical protein
MNKIKVLAVAAVLGLVSLGGVSAASAGSAQTGNVAIDLPNEAVKGGTSVVVPVTLSEFSFTDLTVRLVPGSGTLTLANPGQLTLNPGYTSFEAQPSISFHGALADVVSALQTNLSWTAPGDAESSSLLTIRVEVTKYVSGTTYDPLTGHTYMYIETPLSWHDALVAAKGMTYQGLTGYLATITSQEENDFIGTKSGAQDIWIGATDDQSFVNEARAAAGKDPINFDSQLTGDYYWAAGPEIGTQFQVGLITPTPVDAGYSNWNHDEPNNWSGIEGCATTNEGGQLGIWNDLDCTGEHSYLVEFSTTLEIFETSVFTFDNITGDSKDVNPPAVDPVEPTVDLADTGFDAWLLVAIAAVLVAAGAGARVVTRRK